MHSTASPIQVTDAIVQGYRQGDCFLGEREFVSLGKVPGDSGLVDDWCASTVPGLVLVSQTCDIVRSCEVRPVVELAPLIEVSVQELKEIKAQKRPSFGFIPGLEQLRLVADLDRTMTVEKAVVAGWDVTPGIRDDSETRQFQRCLARKRSRFAFPDDFNAHIAPLHRRVVEKHGKQSPEGEALRSLIEIRVLAQPSWDADRVNLTFFFVKEEDSPAEFDHRPWDAWCDDWLKIIRTGGVQRFVGHDGLVVEYADMSAAEFLQSDQLDLERLSASMNLAIV